MFHYPAFLSEGGEQSIVVSYMEHTSLAYGVDWCRLPMKQLPISDTQYNESDNKTYCSRCDDKDKDIDVSSATIIGSCSFYDHVLHLWLYG